MKQRLSSNQQCRGFTLIELFVVIAIIVVLAALVVQIGSNSIAQSNIRRTEANIVAIGSAVEQYKLNHGRYPRPVGGSTDPIVQAKMLYQVVTGDGSDMIDGADPIASSNHMPATESELILEAAVPGGKRSNFVHTKLYLLDAWGQPYRYVRGDERTDTMNKRTFDLWSPGTRHPEKEDDDTKWITNWR